MQHVSSVCFFVFAHLLFWLEILAVRFFSWFADGRQCLNNFPFGLAVCSRSQCFCLHLVLLISVKIFP